MFDALTLLTNYFIMRIAFALFCTQFPSQNAQNEPVGSSLRLWWYWGLKSDFALCVFARGAGRDEFFGLCALRGGVPVKNTKTWNFEKQKSTKKKTKQYCFQKLSGNDPGASGDHQGLSETPKISEFQRVQIVEKSRFQKFKICELRPRRRKNFELKVWC